MSEPEPTSSSERKRTLTRGLNPEQHLAVTTEADRLCILAGAGSGKTRVLTRRIAYRVEHADVDPFHVLAVTFTRKAASELRSRLSHLGLRQGVTAGTFHAIASAQLRQRWEERGITPPTLLDRKVGFVARLMRSRSATAPVEVVGEIEWAKARMIPAPDYPAAAAAAGRRATLDPEQVAAVYTRYEEEKLSRRLVDFDDLLRLAARDLRADATFAAARRWRFRHLFVDEFQDVNPLQFELLGQWLGEQPDLCVVGDPNQAIYAWNGADASYLTGIDQWLPGVQTVVLDRNYRSSPQILGLANAVLATGPATPVQLRPTRPDGATPTVRRVADDQAEARLIARRLRDHHAPGRSWSEQAVLVRTNAQLGVIEEALRAVGVPFRSRTGTRLLDQPEVRDALRSLRTAHDVSEGLADLELSIRQGEPHPGDPDSEDAPQDERAANLAELVRLGREYLALDPGGTLPGFDSWLRATMRADDGSAGRDAVDLATFHSAKGLEWEVVHLAGFEEGLVPIGHARSANELDEERRLLYVAMTRARTALHLTWAERRTFGTRSVPRKASPYLETVELVLDLLGRQEPVIDLAAAVRQHRRSSQAEAGERPGRRRRSPATSATPAGRLAGHEAAVFEALKAWRRTQAKAADVPAFVIFSDATLVAIAQTRPADRRGLLEVSGVGPVKVERFGDAVLEVVAAAGVSPGDADGPPAAARNAPDRRR